MGETSLMSVDETSPEVGPSDSGKPRLHDYTRAPHLRAIAEGKLAMQGGLCARPESEGVLCDGIYLELDHINANPDDWTWDNLQLLCERHHRIKTNRDRARVRHPVSVCVKKPRPTADRAKWASKEGQKAEWSRPEFDKWIANTRTWLELGRKTGMDLELGEPAYLKDLLDFGADSINDPDFPEGVSQETLRRYVNARRFSTLKLDKIGHRTTVKFVGEPIVPRPGTVEEPTTASAGDKI